MMLGDERFIPDVVVNEKFAFKYFKYGFAFLTKTRLDLMLYSNISEIRYVIKAGDFRLYVDQRSCRSKTDFKEIAGKLIESWKEQRLKQLETSPDEKVRELESRVIQLEQTLRNIKDMFECAPPPLAGSAYLEAKDDFVARTTQ